jgi:hypothetical protein
MSQLKVNLHSFSSGETFGHTTLPVNSLLIEFNLPAQIVVGSIRVMMKETKGFHTRFNGEVHRIAKGRVPPPASEFVFLLCILGIMDQQVRTLAELYVFRSTQPPFVLEIQFIIREKYKNLALLYEFVAIATVGVTERYRADFESVQVAIAGFHVWTLTAKIEFGPQEAKVYREKRRFHLVGKILSYGILSMRAAAEGDGEGVRIGGLKKREPGEVVPMRMSEEKPNVSDFFFLRQSFAEISNS